MSLRGRLARQRRENEFKAGNGTVRLTNPVREHFAAFIAGNAQYCDDVVVQDSAAGQHIVICGAGPTLAEHAAEWCPKGDQVWGCNSAATWLHEQGHKVTHAFTVDQTPQMLEEWYTAPPVEYLVASTIHPHLTDYLLSKGRTLRWFHNYVGLEERPVEIEGKFLSYEDWMYAGLYPVTVRAGSGLNAVTRAIDVALFSGAERITVLGADCALRVTQPMPAGCVPGSPEHTRWLEEGVIMHADGGHALTSGATATTLEAEIDGRFWLTKPDLAITAMFLVDMVRAWRPRLALIGDTLPGALVDKPDEYLLRLPHLSYPDGTPVRYARPADDVVGRLDIVEKCGILPHGANPSAA